jgi:hypothetical protein
LFLEQQLSWSRVTNSRSWHEPVSWGFCRKSPKYRPIWLCLPNMDQTKPQNRKTLGIAKLPDLPKVERYAPRINLSLDYSSSPCSKKQL